MSIKIIKNIDSHYVEQYTSTMKYEIINHTADVGIRAFGKDVNELFENTAYGMFEIIASLNNVTNELETEIEIKDDGLDDMLHDFLSELLFKYEVENILFGKFIVKSLDKKGLKGTALGEKIDLNRHRIKTEIKAVTYHQLKVKKEENHWIAEVIFDI